jgi:hypothetical protein
VRARENRRVPCLREFVFRKRVEFFGWTKTVASFRKTRFRGQALTQFAAHLVAAANNLLRIAKLMPA